MIESLTVLPWVCPKPITRAERLFASCPGHIAGWGCEPDEPDIGGCVAPYTLRASPRGGNLGERAASFVADFPDAVVTSVRYTDGRRVEYGDHEQPLLRDVLEGMNGVD